MSSLATSSIRLSRMGWCSQHFGYNRTGHCRRAVVSLFLAQWSRQGKTSNVPPCRCPVSKERRGGDGDRGKYTFWLLFAAVKSAPSSDGRQLPVWRDNLPR